jgi:hypothetical protein
VVAPPGSAWAIAGATTATPTLDASLPGTYRARLVVTDPEAATSAEAEVVVTVTGATPSTTTTSLAPSGPAAPGPSTGGTGTAPTAGVVPRTPRFTG